MCLKYLVDILAEVTTWCNHDPTPDPIITIQYGALYNWYAATDVRNIANTDWHLPTATEMLALRNYLDPINNDAINNIAGGLMKEIGTVYWQSPNAGATNGSKFNGRGSGKRDGTVGTFVNLVGTCTFWNTRDNSATEGGAGSLSFNDDNFFDAINSATLKKSGCSIRLLKDSTTLSDGEEGTYLGNDSKLYRTICIGTQEWVADNIAETKYRDGTDIPIVTDNAAWAALVTGAMCYYDNDISNM